MFVLVPAVQVPGEELQTSARWKAAQWHRLVFERTSPAFTGSTRQLQTYGYQHQRPAKPGGGLQTPRCQVSDTQHSACMSG